MSFESVDTYARAPKCTISTAGYPATNEVAGLASAQDALSTMIEVLYLLDADVRLTTQRWWCLKFKASGGATGWRVIAPYYSLEQGTFDPQSVDPKTRALSFESVNAYAVAPRGAYLVSATGSDGTLLDAWTNAQLVFQGQYSSAAPNGASGLFWDVLVSSNSAGSVYTVSILGLVFGADAYGHEPERLNVLVPGGLNTANGVYVLDGDSMALGNSTRPQWTQIDPATGQKLDRLAHAIYFDDAAGVWTIINTVPIATASVQRFRPWQVCGHWAITFGVFVWPDEVDYESRDAYASTPWWRGVSAVEATGATLQGALNSALQGVPDGAIVWKVLQAQNGAGTTYRALVIYYDTETDMIPVGY